MSDALIVDPNLHDGHLNSIALQEGGVVIGCSRVDGLRYELVLSELVRLRADDFREGNIILSVERFIGTECPRDLVLELYGAGSDPTPPWMAKTMDQIEREGWTLVSMASSYGCSLSALAKGRLEIRRVE